MSIIDTHAHLYEKDTYKDLAGLVENLKNKNIEGVILPGTCLDDDTLIKSCVYDFKNFFYPMLGIHPDYVKENSSDYNNDIKEIENKIENYKYTAIGEVGLDYYGEKNNIEYQKKFIDTILDIAINSNLPVSIHCREAFDDMYNLIKNKVKRGLKGVIHCFTGNIEEAKKYIDNGFYLGIGGIITFKKSKLKDVICELGLNNVVLETDSPYLSPEPLRGTINDSGNLNIVVDFISKLIGISIDEVEKITTNNAKNIFNLK